MEISNIVELIISLVTVVIAIGSAVYSYARARAKVDMVDRDLEIVKTKIEHLQDSGSQLAVLSADKVKILEGRMDRFESMHVSCSNDLRCRHDAIMNAINHMNSNLSDRIGKIEGDIKVMTTRIRNHKKDVDSDSAV